jgi:hydroxymethylglutaryl-CoA lyase
MAGAGEVMAGLGRPPATTWWALVPNRKGAELAMAAGVDHLTVTVSASPVYSEKNVHMTIAESVEQVRTICELDSSLTVDACVSCAFGSSFGDAVTSTAVADIAKAVLDAGADQLTLADTTGTATPRRIASVLALTGSDVGLHLHDTRSTALTNAIAAIEMGVTRFDTAVAGLGGSPFAPGAGGNLATEALVLMLDDLGFETGIELGRLLEIGERLSQIIGRELPSRVLRAGPLPAFAG